MIGCRSKYTDEQKIALALALIHIRKQGRFHAVHIHADQVSLQHHSEGPRFAVTWQGVAKIVAEVERNGASGRVAQP